MTASGFSVYDASAGSGKTFTLVKAYLQIILSHPSDDAFKSVLAITFTNKAASEIEARLRRQGMTGLFTGTFHRLCLDWLRIVQPAVITRNATE